MQKQDKNEIKVLITEFYTTANHGDEAIILGMEKGIKHHLPNSDIKISSAFPHTTERMTNIKSIPPLISLYGRRQLWRVPFFVIGLLFMPNSKWYEKLFPMIKEYKKADVIVCSGGGFLNDNYHPAILGRLLGLYAANKLKKKVFIYSASIGPFNKKSYRFLTRFVLSKLDGITVRDEPSLKELNDLKVNAPIDLVADSAFALYEDHLPTKQINDQLRNKTRISISVRKWSHYSKGSQELYEQAIVGFLDKILQESTNYEVIFVSSCVGTDGYKADDRKVARKIYDQLSNKENVSLITEDLSANNLIEFYKTIDLNIGTRMHTNIFSLLSGTPVVAIRYEDKTIGLMEQFDLSEYLLDIDNITTKKLYNTVKNNLENRDVIIDKISKQLPIQKQSSLKSAELLTKLT